MSDTIPIQAGGEASGGPQAILDSVHDQAKAHFDAASQAIGRMDRVRAELGELARKGTAITPEDVIHGAGKLVAGGEDPMQLAGLMADMPVNGGDALAAWIAEHYQATAQKEAQLRQGYEASRHSAGVAALHSLMGHVVHPQGTALRPQSRDVALDPTAGATGPNALGGQ